MILTADGADAFVSQHIGDLECVETMRHWERSCDAFSRMLRIDPRVVARDLHPEYLSTRLAEQMARRTMVVQHHHAHIAAVAAENGVVDRVVGIAFDGTGYGADEAIWGGEFLVANLVSYRRVGQLRYAPLPGGDAAARQGWRAAVGYASVAPVEDRDAIERRLQGVQDTAMRIARQQCARHVNAPPASSMGRLFDAAAATLGVCCVSRFEGEAAMRLESIARADVSDTFELPIEQVGDRLIMDPVVLLAELALCAAAGDDPAFLAAVFHESVARATAELATRIAEREKIDVVALGGGVFQNARLLSSVRGRLSSAGLRVLLPRALPPNDGAISYGQAAVVAARMAMDIQEL